MNKLADIGSIVVTNFESEKPYNVEILKFGPYPNITVKKSPKGKRNFEIPTTSVISFEPLP